MDKKLRKSKKDKIISGVCGGLGDFFNINSNIIRFIWLVAILRPSSPGFLFYLLASVIIPEQSYNYDAYISNDTSNFSQKNTKSILGFSLILIGFFMLINRIWPNFLNFFKKLISFWPLLLIVLGIYLIKSQKNR